MINCERAKELFSDCLDGGADAALTNEVRQHIQTCPACSRDLDQFKHTWRMLDSVEAVPVPSGFRHDVLMRMARLQHESRYNRVPDSFDLRGFFRGLIPLRGIAVAVSAAMLAVMLLSLTDVLQHRDSDTTIAGPPGTGIQNQQQVLAQTLGSSRVSPWKARVLGRNTVWVDVTKEASTEGTILYRVLLSINQAAMLPDETANRIGARLYLLPPGTYDPELCKSSHPEWEGNILKDVPVVVPVFVNPNQTGAGSVNLLVSWSRYGRDFAQLVILPAGNGLSDSSYSYSAGRTSFAIDDNSIYSLLQKAAVEYWVPVIANAHLNVRPKPVNFAGEDMDQTLQGMLKPIDLDWLYAGDTLHVDYTYKLP